METIISDIREKIQQQKYVTEEHIRFSLVGRILQKCGWDIWHPSEVFTEFCPNRMEDNTKVDIALFLPPYNIPSVFIEVKALGKIGNLSQVETQLRDYNRNNTAPISIITDGNLWRFYYALTGGTFADKCFKHFNVLTDDAEEILDVLDTFLSKRAIQTGIARTEAEKYLKQSRLERLMSDAEPEARRLVTQPPFPSLPKALVQLVSYQGEEITEDIAISFLQGHKPNIRPVKSIFSPKTSSDYTPIDPTPSIPIASNSAAKSDFRGYILFGEKKECKNQNAIYKSVLEDLLKIEATVLDGLYAHTKDKKSGRRWIANYPQDLYLSSPELVEKKTYYFQIGEWFVDNHQNLDNKQQRIEKACEIAGIQLGKDLIIYWEKPQQS